MKPSVGRRWKIFWAVICKKETPLRVSLFLWYQPRAMEIRLAAASFLPVTMKYTQ